MVRKRKNLINHVQYETVKVKVKMKMKNVKLNTVA